MPIYMAQISIRTPTTRVGDGHPRRSLSAAEPRMRRSALPGGF